LRPPAAQSRTARWRRQCTRRASPTKSQCRATQRVHLRCIDRDAKRRPDRMRGQAPGQRHCQAYRSASASTPRGCSLRGRVVRRPRAEPVPGQHRRCQEAPRVDRGRELTRRLRPPASDETREHRWDDADQEQPVPAERRHNQHTRAGGGERADSQANGNAPLMRPRILAGAYSLRSDMSIGTVPPRPMPARNRASTR